MLPPLNRLARAGADLASAISTNDVDQITAAIAALEAAVVQARAVDVWHVDADTQATLHALAGSLTSAAARVEKLTGATRRRRALVEMLTGCSLRTVLRTSS